MPNNDRALLLRSRMGNEFADAVYTHLSTRYADLFSLEDVSIDRFPNGEPKVQVRANVAQRRVYLVHAFEGFGEPESPHKNYDPSTGTMTLYLINDALKRSQAGAITNVLPHIPWQRQDRKEEGRVPISSAVFMQQLGVAGGNRMERVITIEMHSGQQQGFADYAVDNLYANRVFAEHFRKLGDDFVVVAPDVGGGNRAGDLARKLKAAGPVYAHKIKRGAEKERVEIIGMLGGRKRAIIPDDMVDSGKTLCLAARALRRMGVEEVYGCATHALFSPKSGNPAERRLQQAGIQMVVGDTIPMSEEYRTRNKEWLTVLSFVPLFAEAIYQRDTGGSVSELFKDD